jgi:hypothetical protein
VQCSSAAANAMLAVCERPNQYWLGFQACRRIDGVSISALRPVVTLGIAIDVTGFAIRPQSVLR